MQQRVDPVEIQAEAAVVLRIQVEFRQFRAPQAYGIADVGPECAVQDHAIARADRRRERHGHRCHAGGGDLDPLLATGLACRRVR